METEVKITGQMFRYVNEFYYLCNQTCTILKWKIIIT